MKRTVAVRRKTRQEGEKQNKTESWGGVSTSWEKILSLEIFYTITGSYTVKQEQHTQASSVYLGT